MNLRRSQTWVTLVAALTVILVGVNMVLFDRNRALQADVNTRAQYIQQTLQVEALHREIVNAIANLSVRNKDEALRTVLTQHGITVTASQAPVPAEPTASGAVGGKSAPVTGR